MDGFLNSGIALTKVGQGFCGTVWAEATEADTTTSSLVIKRADGGPERSLANEQHIHKKILSAAHQHNKTTGNSALAQEDASGTPSNHISSDDVLVHIPENFAFLEADSGLWSKLLPRLQHGFAPCQALINERILPMPLEVRELLAGRYARGDKSEVIRLARDKSNECCLIRPYLGKRRPSTGGPLRFLSLRNFPLHINQMEELALPVEEYAIAMANSLAFLHWVAKVDASDVEVVLARPRSNNTSASIGKKDLQCDTFGRHGMWLLDFDCCKDLEMTADGMLRAARCFWRNDPFYPRPGSKDARDEQLWHLFECQFLKKSRVFLKSENDEIQELPALLMELILENRDTWSKGAMEN